LGTAYFLIAGEEYVAKPGNPSLPKDTALALRGMFRAEQLEAAALMDACQNAGDPCLARLYRELAEEDRTFADRVRARLEERRPTL